ncbi:beta-galactosidase-1-like protein 2 isoform X2 [Rhinatrema bivittatum]|uniref:beta-galactosidase-1-like protein 2 isoform X2 n=1 Tax=Rhinatrema bivittatum TaxID=194408 RepID=UPI00112C7AE5|nr:beta-galactosidase-1-like protein 2 isoform X2 [Rhinatrema bivittatum]
MRREQCWRLGAFLLLLLGVVLLCRYNWIEFIPFKMWNRGIGLQAGESMFELEGRPFRIFGGSMHYFRVPRDYWRDRMLKMKACGLNTLTTYVAWNLHEPTRGKFDFSGNLDIEAFVKMAADIGLWVIMRPGPYICAEWDLGGLPSWLLRDKNMQLRTTYKGFTEATDGFFDKLIPKLAHLQYQKGGPIIAVQVENEYGSYAKDPNYLDYVKTALLKRGIVELLVTSDNKDGLSSGSLEGVLATINFQKLEPVLFSYLDTIQTKKPKMVMEYWTGWFDQWGSDHHVFDADMVVETVQEILKSGASINLYMFHGGTNFGFMNGALHFIEYKADVTSYDYDAPLTEAGDYTSKYYKLRDLFSKFIEEPLPIPPSVMTKGSYGMVQIKQYVSLWDVLQSTEEPFKTVEPINMENLSVNDDNGQSYGYTLYETVIFGGGQFHSQGNIRDRAQVFVSNQLVGSIDFQNLELNIAEVPGYRKLRILIENCGRVNYGPKLNNQRKGMVGDVLLRSAPLRNFKIYSLDMKKSFIESLQVAQWNDVPDEPEGPAFFRGTLRVGFMPLDTFLKLEGWEKGVIFVNGQNLGRYWNIGPQSTLYLPGTWLHPGENEIIIFEQYRAGRLLQSMDVPLLGKTLYVD